MTDPTSLQAIAARLTPRQREAVRYLPPDGNEITWWRGLPGPDISELTDLDLAEWTMIGYGFDCYRLTPLGRRVREVVAHG